MPTGAPIPVREYTSADEMRRHAAEVRARLFAPRRIIVVPPAPVVVPEPVEDEAYDDFVACTLEAFKPQYRVRRLTVRECLNVVSLVTDTPVEAMKGDRRIKALVKARHIASWALVRRLMKSLPEAGRHLGDRDHTTVLNGVRRVEYAVRDLRIDLPAMPAPPQIEVDPDDAEMTAACAAAHVAAQTGALSLCVDRLWSAAWPAYPRRRGA